MDPDRRGESRWADCGAAQPTYADQAAACVRGILSSPRTRARSDPGKTDTPTSRAAPAQPQTRRTTAAVHHTGAPNIRTDRHAHAGNRRPPARPARDAKEVRPDRTYY